MLAPYSEGLEVEPYIDITKEELMQHLREHKAEHPEETKTLDQLYTDYISGYDSKVDKDGNILTTYNPNSKWDWWVVGGRYSERLTTKSGDLVDAEQFKNLVFNQVLAENNPDVHFRTRFWEICVEGKPLIEGENQNDFFAFYKPEYYLRRYNTKEEFIKKYFEFSTHAVVTPDGVWHEVGELLMFGMSTDTPEEAQEWDEKFFDRFLKDRDPDDELIIVDYHI